MNIIIIINWFYVGVIHYISIAVEILFSSESLFIIYCFPYLF